MVYFQIGTSEPRDCIGSRTAKSDNIKDAIEECRQRSMGRGIRGAWVRPVIDGKMENVIATFVKGVEV